MLKHSITNQHAVVIQRTENHILQPIEEVITPTFQLACDIFSAMQTYYMTTGQVAYEKGKQFSFEMLCLENGVFAAYHDWDSDRACKGMPQPRIGQPDFIKLVCD